MDDKSYNVRIPKRWVRIAMIVGATALVVAPLTAIASHSFTDVPNSNIFHSDIEWLADAGVTKGCNPPSNTQFCPKDNVTREAMSAFMRRFAKYIDAEDGTPGQADNADMLDGKDSDEVMSRVWGSNDSNGAGSSVSGVTASNLEEINSVSIDAPANGFLVISGNVFVNPTTATNYVIQPLLDGNTIAPGPDIGESGWIALFNPSPDDHNFSMAYTVVTAVTAGSHTVSQEIGPFSGSADFFFNKQTLTVQFIPSGSVEANPSALDGQGGSGVGS